MSPGHRATSCTPSSPPGAEDPGCGCPPGSAGHQGAPSCPPWDPRGQELGQRGRARRWVAAQVARAGFQTPIERQKATEPNRFLSTPPRADWARVALGTSHAGAGISGRGGSIPGRAPSPLPGHGTLQSRTQHPGVPGALRAPFWQPVPAACRMGAPQALARKGW